MDSAKNKRLLLAACQANGIALPDGAPPSYMQARILGLRPAKMARTDEEAPPAAPASTTTLNKDTFVEDETQRIGASLGGVTARNKPQLTLEAESRYDEIKARLKKDDDLFLENVTPDMADQLKSSGWIAIIVEPSGTYFRKPAAPVPKPAQSGTAADILEEQEQAYAIAQVADMEKEEAEKAEKAATLAANSAADAPAPAAAASVGSVNAAANDEMAEELVTTARRRLMDWMVINNNPVQMGMMLGLPNMLGLAKHSVDELEGINPRLLASKLAYAVFPEATELVGLSTTDKQKAAKPETLWTGSEIDLLVGSDSVTVQAAAPAASSVDTAEEAVEGAVKPVAAVDDADSGAAACAVSVSAGTVSA